MTAGRLDVNGACGDFSGPDGVVELDQPVEFGAVLLFPSGVFVLKSTCSAVPGGEGLEVFSESLDVECDAVLAVFELGSFPPVHCAS